MPGITGMTVVHGNDWNFRYKYNIRNAWNSRIDWNECDAWDDRKPEMCGMRAMTGTARMPSMTRTTGMSGMAVMCGMP